MERKRTSIVLLVASVCMFLVSMPLWATAQTWPGYGVLLFGWLESLCVANVGIPVALGWFANPAILGTWILIITGDRKFATISGGAGLFFGSMVLMGKHVVYNESGSGLDRLEFGPGYWCWLVCLLLGFVGALLMPRKA